MKNTINLNKTVTINLNHILMFLYILVSTYFILDFKYELESVKYKNEIKINNIQDLNKKDYIDIQDKYFKELRYSKLFMQKIDKLRLNIKTYQEIIKVLEDKQCIKNGVI
jgi:hypothetical protein